MKQTGLASRYARALAEVVGEKKALEEAAEQLEGMAALYRDSKELKDFLDNPAYPLDAKKKGLAALGERRKVLRPVARLMEILLSKGRIDLAPEVASEFRRIEEEALGRIAVELTTAQSLDAALEEKIVASLEKFTGKKVRVTPVVDPGVLGGVRARIGSVIYDGTVAARLERLKQRLIEER
jgi:F-type H+-transporting ATPase subunit delta